MFHLISEGRFDNIRKHILTKKKFSRKGLTEEQIYQRKKESRLRRQNELISTEEREEFFCWIEAIQTKLKLSDTKFGKEIGVTVQTIYLWKRRAGHYPCTASFNQLLRLEKECRIEIKDLKVVYEIAA